MLIIIFVMMSWCIPGKVQQNRDVFYPYLRENRGSTKTENLKKLNVTVVRNIINRQQFFDINIIFLQKLKWWLLNYFWRFWCSINFFVEKLILHISFRIYYLICYKLKNISKQNYISLLLKYSENISFKFYLWFFTNNVDGLIWYI